ncbi:EDD domain protein, DegV family [Anaerococcus hydrogenalis DSM 7454]|uniref:EDD domain protein, DegV family n=1 Tax=Anaerococcus hydrogenalis DSM 7454 TaxID=561177 RepID=B6WBW0_9FIRM|nr:DegV family protein [Anaerococcus hydrogenalis]EEB35129.1 EDD domain protein, DegV family [Anaerococcus hydrogenalis DSM 7454]
MTFKIITDGSSDMNVDFIKSSNITIVPMQSNMEDEVYEIIGTDLENLNKYYEFMLDDKNVSTSQVNLASFEKYFEEALEDGQDIFYIGLSDSLSGTFKNAQRAKEILEKKYPDRKIYIYDPKQASTGAGLLCQIIVKMQEEGKDIDQIDSFIKENSKYMVSQFGVESLKYLYKGGRISKTSADIGNFLKVKPVIHITDEGSLEVLKLERGTKRAIKVLFKNFQKKLESRPI